MMGIRETGGIDSMAYLDRGRREERRRARGGGECDVRSQSMNRQTKGRQRQKTDRQTTALHENLVSKRQRD